MKADATLDAFGLICPMPIIKTSQKIKELRVGEVLEVLATDEGIKEDMPAWCRTTGHEYLGLEEEHGEYHVYVRKTRE
ncbi:MAG: sulfurtransferase TusA family protein [Chloroflexi bacterium]|nr:sulfurtransferase TusA family protein [Chloroflexota bacterium]